MINLLTTHEILNKRRINGLVYWTLSSVIFIGPILLGFLGRGLCLYNVFGISLMKKKLCAKVIMTELAIFIISWKKVLDKNSQPISKFSSNAYFHVTQNI